MCHRVPERYDTLGRIYDEFLMLRYCDARQVVRIGNWPVRDECPDGCFNLCDFIVGYDKEVVVGPKETGVIVRNDCYFDVREQAAIATVPDSHTICSSCRDAISLEGVFPCVNQPVVCEYLHLFSRSQVPNGGRFVQCRYESGRVGREIEASNHSIIEFLVRQDKFMCLCVPYMHLALVRSPCYPLAILGHSQTEDRMARFHTCRSLPVFYSPLLNPTTTTAQEILAIHRKRHCIPMATDVDFNCWVTVLFPPISMLTVPILSGRTVHCRRCSHDGS